MAMYDGETSRLGELSAGREVPADPRSARRTAGLRAGTIAASLLLAFLCAELAVRALNAAPDLAVVRKGRYRLSADPQLGFEPVPERTVGADPAGLYDYVGASNSLGFRDPDPRPAGGAVRGAGLEPRDAARFERRKRDDAEAHEQRPRSGNDPPQHAAKLRKGSGPALWERF